MSVIESGDLRQSFPRLDSYLAVGFRRQHQDRFRRVDVGLQLSHTFSRTVSDDTTTQVLETFDLMLGVP